MDDEQSQRRQSGAWCARAAQDLGYGYSKFLKAKYFFFNTQIMDEFRAHNSPFCLMQCMPMHSTLY